MPTSKEAHEWLAHAIENDELAHFGVLGMRWGVRKDAGGSQERAQAKQNKIVERQKKRDARAAKWITKAEQYNSEIRRLDSAVVKNKRQQKRINKDKLELHKNAEEAVRNAEARRKGKLTSNEKKLIIGASVVAAVIAANVIQDKIQSGEAQRSIARGKAFVLKKNATDFAKNPVLARKDLSVDEIKKLVVDKINPEYGKIGTKMNCRRATMAYEMRRRGFDVVATRTTNANGQNAAGLLNVLSPGKAEINTNSASVFSRSFKELTDRTTTTPLTDLSLKFSAGATNKIEKTNIFGIFNALSGQPNGSRGEIAVQWGMGGGHSMAYEIIKGNPVIFDSQSGKVFNNAVEFAKGIRGGQTGNISELIAQAGFTRLDNVKLNTDYLLKWVKDAA